MACGRVELQVSVTTRLTLFGPPQPGHTDGGKGEHILVGRRALAARPWTGTLGISVSGHEAPHDGQPI
jgi:hypothetical protein